MGYGTLLSDRFEFPRPLAAADRTQIWVNFYFLSQDIAENTRTLL